jgi:hypothetical protein
LVGGLKIVNFRIMESNLLYFMKNTSELRQGNLILQSHLKNINVVIGIKPSYILTDCKVAEGGWVADSLYEPIPLTEEWLTKFGFTKHLTESNEGCSYFKIGVLSLMRSDSLSYGCSFDPENSNSWFTEIKYIHQLQNLYYALKSEELLVK